MTTSPADRQRLKRQRRAEAGMVKCEAWLTPENAKRIEMLKGALDMTASEVIDCAISRMKIAG